VIWGQGMKCKKIPATFLIPGGVAKLPVGFRLTREICYGRGVTVGRMTGVNDAGSEM
jgi:hypothetical protein